jgi:hypothetical protein
MDKNNGLCLDQHNQISPERDKRRRGNRRLLLLLFAARANIELASLTDERLQPVKFGVNQI